MGKKEVHYCGFWKRVAVQFIDGSVGQIPIFILAGLVLAEAVALSSLGMAPLILLFVGSLLVIAINVYLYFSYGKTIGDYVMKTRLGDVETLKKPTSKKLWSRFFYKNFVSMPIILLILMLAAGAVLYAFSRDNIGVSIVVGIIMAVLSIVLIVWPIIAFGRAGWDEKKQAYHDKKSGIFYLEEKQYSGGLTWLAVLLLIGFAFFNAGAQQILGLGDANSFMIEMPLQQKMLQQNFEMPENADEMLNELTPEQKEQIQRAFQQQIEAQMKVQTENSAE